jgi:hypothetical protein
MVEKIKNLHNAIPIEINEHVYNFYTVGYIAHVLQRTIWTIGYWERIDLFPKSPFLLYSKVAKTNYRVYPEAFIDELQVIVGCRYLGKRLNFYDRKRFYYEVRDAYEWTITPLVNQGVTGGFALKDKKDMTRQVILVPTHSM